MRDWMLELPPYTLNSDEERAFEIARNTGDAKKLPEPVSRWVFLQRLTKQGFLLHGSNHADIAAFEPRTPKDFSPDEFSKRTAVFASSDGVWAMMYALISRARTKRILNMALQVHEHGSWSPMRYFLSLAPRGPNVTEGRKLLQNGYVYVLPKNGFEQMPAYHWPGLGDVLEPHWATPHFVRPLMYVSVSPADFPLPVRTHDAAHVDALSQTDPWGFPWLEP